MYSDRVLGLVDNFGLICDFQMTQALTLNLYTSLSEANFFSAKKMYIIKTETLQYLLVLEKLPPFGRFFSGIF